jgi:ribosomal protein S21
MKGGITLPLIKIKEDETFENALRRFKRKCEKSGILSELKKRQHFENPYLLPRTFLDFLTLIKITFVINRVIMVNWLQ